MRIVLRVGLGLGIAAMLGACGSSNNNPTGPSNVYFFSARVIAASASGAITA
jgi:hypothetical protein